MQTFKPNKASGTVVTTYVRDSGFLGDNFEMNQQITISIGNI